MKKPLEKIMHKIISLGIVIVGLTITGIFSSLLIDHPIQNKPTKELIKIVSSPLPVPTPTATPTASPTELIYNKPLSIPIKQTPSPTVISSPQSQNSQPETSPQPSSIPTLSPSSQPTYITVNLSINGAAAFSISITEGSNQCDVLRQAQIQGEISTLTIRYNTTFGSDAVYQINDLGKDNVVWWTYLVNGQSPNQGCSYIKVNNNDNIEWKYLGS